jgi:ADP-ribose pyrophosphatase YjhB (NUDIX family)
VNREYPDRPIVGVGALIIEVDRVVLVRRSNEPLKGEWSLPGGMLELGETLHQGVIREALEETGLRVDPVELAGVFDRIIPDSSGKPKYHYVLIDYVCKVIGGVLRAGSDVQEVCWANAAELKSFSLSSVTEELIRQKL